MSNILLDTLDKQPLICAEGFLFEMERRGYLTSGEFVPEVALEHPEVLENLHKEFQHAGSNIVEAFTYNGHREKLRVINKENFFFRMIFLIHKMPEPCISLYFMGLAYFKNV